MTEIESKLPNYGLIFSLVIYVGFIFDILFIKLGTWSFSDFNLNDTTEKTSIFVYFSARSHDTYTGDLLITTLGPSLIGYLTLIALPLFGSVFTVKLLNISSKKDEKLASFVYSIILVAFVFFDAFMILMMYIRVQGSANGVNLSDVLVTQLFIILFFLTLFQSGIILIIAQMVDKHSIHPLWVIVRWIMIMILFLPYLYILASVANADVHVL